MRTQRHGRAPSVVVVGALVIAVALPLAGGVASASRTAVPRAMVGCWHRHAPALSVGTPAGVWLLKIESAGELLAFAPGAKSCAGEPDFTALISVSGTHLTIGSVPVCAAKGIYTWKRQGTALTLRTTADKSCSPRRLLFTGVWRKT